MGILLRGIPLHLVDTLLRGIPLLHTPLHLVDTLLRGIPLLHTHLQVFLVHLLHHIKGPYGPHTKGKR
ncbi:hypothetical protein C4D60_Mb06t33960 [Musa balbisiana]|uniref:Uncharacterized protein n=1 Tax=Musa balbisiana TaxID=52838 RepID=A0A4S8ITY7_MUSBA|nr:hypothetical protein C4D60_Mb06t33960 [Musa balbisiana]